MYPSASMSDLRAPACQAFERPNIPNFVLSLLILIGIFISYLPQHFRIVWRRSSEGLSPYYILLGTTSAICAFANVIALPASQDALHCCKQISGFECAAGVLGMAQICLQSLCFTVILLLWLLFFPRATPAGEPLQNGAPKTQTALIIACICFFHGIITLFCTIAFIIIGGAKLRIWAELMGIMGTILATIQFIPQIWTTWKLQAVGSLSIPMMLIQTPGAFVFVVSLAARLGWQGWSTWAVYLITGILQGCLLAMAISFVLRDRRQGIFEDTLKDSVQDPTAEPVEDESTPLLPEQDSQKPRDRSSAQNARSS